jgi:hypothetical protein
MLKNIPEPKPKLPPKKRRKSKNYNISVAAVILIANGEVAKVVGYKRLLSGSDVRAAEYFDISRQLIQNARSKLPKYQFDLYLARRQAVLSKEIPKDKLYDDSVIDTAPRNPTKVGPLLIINDSINLELKI